MLNRQFKKKTDKTYEQKNLPMQLCTRTDRAVRRIIVFLRLQNKTKIELAAE